MLKHKWLYRNWQNSYLSESLSDQKIIQCDDSDETFQAWCNRHFSVSTKTVKDTCYRKHILLFCFQN